MAQGEYFWRSQLSIVSENNISAPKIRNNLCANNLIFLQIYNSNIRLTLLFLDQLSPLIFFALFLYHSFASFELYLCIVYLQSVYEMLNCVPITDHLYTLYIIYININIKIIFPTKHLCILVPAHLGPLFEPIFKVVQRMNFCGATCK